MTVLLVTHNNRMNYVFTFARHLVQPPGLQTRASLVQLSQF